MLTVFEESYNLLLFDSLLCILLLMRNSLSCCCFVLRSFKCPYIEIIIYTTCINALLRLHNKSAILIGGKRIHFFKLFVSLIYVFLPSLYFKQTLIENLPFFIWKFAFSYLFSYLKIILISSFPTKQKSIK